MSRPFALLTRRLLSALLCSAPLFAFAEAPTAAWWLQRMSQNMQELNYRGVLSYARDGHLESLRLTHGTLDGEPVERLEHLDGERREIIRRGKELTCIQLDQRFSLLLNRRVLRDGMTALENHYEIELGGDERIAGRSAVSVVIKPRDAFRHGYRLGLDRDTGVLLRSEIFDPSGKVLERMQFVDIEIGQPLSGQWLAAAASAGEDRKAAAAAPIARVVEEAQMPWRPQWLPPGFTLSVAPHKTSEDVLTYSDGLAVFSIFIDAARAEIPAGGGRASQGATVAYTRSAQLGSDAATVTVVGEIPAATASRVAESVVWDGGG